MDEIKKISSEIRSLLKQITLEKKCTKKHLINQLYDKVLTLNPKFKDEETSTTFSHRFFGPRTHRKIKLFDDFMIAASESLFDKDAKLKSLLIEWNQNALENPNLSTRSEQRNKDFAYVNERLKNKIYDLYHEEEDSDCQSANDYVRAFRDPNFVVPTIALVLIMYFNLFDQFKELSKLIGETYSMKRVRRIIGPDRNGDYQIDPVIYLELFKFTTNNMSISGALQKAILNRQIYWTANNFPLHRAHSMPRHQAKLKIDEFFDLKFCIDNNYFYFRSSRIFSILDTEAELRNEK